MSVSIVWFRTDLRVEDNLSLALAASVSEVIPLFIWDSNQLAYNSPNQRAFLIESLEDLTVQLQEYGVPLLIRTGKPEEVLQSLVKETSAKALYFGRHYEPNESVRDTQIVKAMHAVGVKCIVQKENVLFESREIQSKVGKPYTIFTPFKKAALEKLFEVLPPFIGITAIKPYKEIDRLSTDAIPILKSSLLTSPKRQHGGSAEAERLWKTFCKNLLKDYKHRRDILADEEGTSRLSPHIKYGTISVRKIVRELIEIIAEDDRRKEGATTFLTQILWREFYSNILQAFPHVAQGAFQEKFNRILWEGKKEHLDPWKEGRTGFPIIDAAMRQLKETGWMHNRARMIVASFLVKDLLLNWQEGEQYFMEMLTDGDLAQNNGGWQWSASTGTDAQPYYRIFNPYLQSKKFDPEGKYIKRYLPELRKLPSKLVHTPHLMTEMEQRSYGVMLGTDYPWPIVDHKKQREKAIALFKSIK